MISKSLYPNARSGFKGPLNYFLKQVSLVHVILLVDWKHGERKLIPILQTIEMTYIISIEWFSTLMQTHAVTVQLLSCSQMWMKMTENDDMMVVDPKWAAGVSILSVAQWFQW